MMTSGKSVSVNAAELLSAFEFVSAGLLDEDSAAICIDTGRIYLALSMIETEEDVPEDLDSDRYIAVPHKHELGWAAGRNGPAAFAPSLTRGGHSGRSHHQAHRRGLRGRA
jgi:hypothetical protein